MSAVTRCDGCLGDIDTSGAYVSACEYVAHDPDPATTFDRMFLGRDRQQHDFHDLACLAQWATWTVEHAKSEAAP